MTRQRGLRIAPDLELPLDLVTEATAIVATRGAGKSSAAAVLVEEAIAAAVQVVVIDWTGVFWGLRSSAAGNGDGLGIYVLGGPHGDVALEHTAGSLIADLVVDSGHSFVLDLSDFNKGQMKRFAADFLDRLYDRKARHRTNMLLLVDEAHELAPQSPRGGFKGDGARLIAAMEQVTALGRSRGIGVVVITQRTQALNKAVLDLIETLLVMRMLSPRARAAVKDWIQEKHEDDEHGVLASLKDLPTGTAWVWSPLRGILQKVAVRRIRTFDSYATPKPGEIRVEPKARKELDLDALGEKMAATVERAQADDPKLLHARIRDLTRELQAEGDRADKLEYELEQLQEAPAPEPQLVHVPVVTAEVLSDFTSAAAPLAELLVNIGAELQQIHDNPIKLPEAGHQGQPTTRPSAPRATSTSRTTGRAPVAGSATTQRKDPPSARETRPAADGGTSVPPARRNLLEALLALESIGVHAAPRNQVALFAGVSPKSSGYANNLGAMNTAGLITYPARGLVQITDEGRAHVDGIPAAATTSELHDRVRDVVSPPRWRIVEPLLDAYPGSLSREDLADHAGVSPSSSGYANNLGALRSLGLIDYPERGQVIASDLLFLEAR